MDITDWLAEHDIRVNNTDLIHQAFIHSSYANEHRNRHDNERLEFMGDAVLQLWSSTQIYPLEPPLSEGEMTRLRSRLVCEKALAEYGRKLGLNQFLKLGAGEEKTDGRNKDAIVADMFEAFLGALYLDQGYEAADKFLHIAMDDDIVHPANSDAFKDYKTKLQEYVQTDRRSSVQYILINEEGPSNCPIFTMHAVVDGLVMGVGQGSSKKQAEQNAARNAFEKMVK